jgi:hypothetical protein
MHYSRREEQEHENPTQRARTDREVTQTEVRNKLIQFHIKAR